MTIHEPDEDPDASLPGDPGSTAANDPPSPARARVRVRHHQGERNISPDLSGNIRRRGTHPGDRYVKVVRRHTDDLRPVRPGMIVASEASLAGKGGFRRFLLRSKRLLIGAPLTTAAAAHERLTKVKALAVLSSDALSSVAYATEEILRVLLLAGLGAMSLGLPIGAAIVVLLLIVGASYRQTIKAYPPAWWRLLHRREGQPRHGPGARRGRGVAGGLHPDSGGVDLLGRGGDGVGLPRIA